MAQSGVGNTSNSTRRVRNWCYTLYSDVPLDIQSTFHVWQREKCPHTSNLHFQGFIILKTPQEFKKVKKLLGERVHIEEAKGSIEQNIAYCTKEDSRVEGPWRTGSYENSGQGKRSDLIKIHNLCKEKKTLEEIVNNCPSEYIKYHNGIDKIRALYSEKRNPNNPVEVIVYWGEPGCGKSRRAFTENPDAFYKDPSTKWWDGYDGQKSVIIDDYWGEIDYRLFLRWLDRYPTTIEVKGGTKQLLATKFIITSNRDPATWYTNSEALLRRITTSLEMEL